MLSGSALTGLSAGSTTPRDPRRTLTSLGVLVYDWDLASDRIDWGPNAGELIGAHNVASWRRGQDFASAVTASDGPTRAELVARSDAADGGTGVAFAVSYGLDLGAGGRLMVDDTGRWFADSSGAPSRVHGTMRLRRGAGAPTDHGRERRALLAQLGADLADAAQAKRPLTVMAIAISNLASLNDAVGFEAADRVVESVLARLCSTMRVRDRFARYSGNRFALVLRGCGPDDAAIAAERLIRLVTGAPIGSPAGALSAELAIGAACAPEHAVNADVLLRRAETILGCVKRREGTQFLLFDPQLFRTVGRERRRDRVLDSIGLLNARQVTLARPAVVEAGSRVPSFWEALLRIEHEDGRLEPAGDIVPALERAGLVHLADNRMLELVTAQLSDDPDLRMSLNVSALTMERPDWLPTLAAHLGAGSGIASRLIVEVTETAAVRDADRVKRVLDAAKALGVSIAIDDFGAGYTSFRNLRNFPVDVVKIDGAFVHNLMRSSEDQFFVRTLIDLAHHIGVATVAEWVEDEATAALLEGWGIDFLQGDHCGRPELVRCEPPSALLVA